MALTQHLPTSQPAPVYADPGPAVTVLSAKPVILPGSEARGANLKVRVSAPAVGDNLPVVLFSHGYGSSLEAYGPLTDYWASHGFVVLQPTYLDSRTVGVPNDDPRVVDFWRFRVTDARRILDDLDTLLAAVPGLPDRVERTLIAAAGHSFGGQTSGILLGQRVGPPAGEYEDLSDPRILVGVLLATAGTGGEDLSDFAHENLSYLNADFSQLSRPTLVVAGDADDSPLTVRGPDWSEDPYRMSPGADQLLTLFGGEHSLGGIPGYEAAETTDQSTPRLGVVQQLTWAYLQTALRRDSGAWSSAIAALHASAEPLGRVESK
ncbi:chlorophyllase [Rhodococcus sp. G-MC3]|uniref:alpha/beta hydrolase family protein n=1 Tax=Rhodococcus sp. G-MC3 TaxID=3046209 RepID=UPI0024B9F9E3|nr:chlorophyllase [Rhodococcus sp. G-MC3]MDJ0396264.1 chlorophyllase [Rhodococcus sp. G-MC3]